MTYFTINDQDTEDHRYETVEAAVRAWLERWRVEGLPFHTTVTVHVHEPMDVDVCVPLRDMLEHLDEEYGNPDGPRTKPTPVMQAAASHLEDIVALEYKSWMHEDVRSYEITTDDGWETWREVDDG